VEAAAAVVRAGDHRHAQGLELGQVVQQPLVAPAVDEAEGRGIGRRSSVDAGQGVLDGHVEGRGADAASDHHQGLGGRRLQDGPAVAQGAHGDQAVPGTASGQRAGPSPHHLDEELEAPVLALTEHREGPGDRRRERVVPAQHEEAPGAESLEGLLQVQGEHDPIGPRGAHLADGGALASGIGGRGGHGGIIGAARPALSEIRPAPATTAHARTADATLGPCCGCSS